MMQIILAETKWNIAKSIIRRVQEVFGEPPDHVKNYQELNTRILEKRYNLIIIGERLEDISCLETLRRLKSLQVSSKIWVYATRGYEINAIEAGADRFYLKERDSNKISIDLRALLNEKI